MPPLVKLASDSTRVSEKKTKSLTQSNLNWLVNETQAKSRHSARVKFKSWNRDRRQNLPSRETTLYIVEGKKTVFLNWGELKIKFKNKP